jgi:diacylglycerol kinase family enzyme
MKRIAFIINPISGNGTQADEITYELLQTYFSNKEYEVRRQIIERKGGTSELVQQAIIGMRILLWHVEAMERLMRLLVI